MSREKMSSPSMLTGFASGFIIIALTVYILNVSAEITMPLVMSIFLWYLINALARAVAGIPWLKGKLSQGMALTIAILIIVAGAWQGFEIIRNNAQKVAAAAPVYQKHFQEMAPLLATRLGLEHLPTLPELMERVDLTRALRVAAGLFTGIAGKTFEVIFFTGFLFYEQKFFNRKLVRMTRDFELQEKIRHILRNIDQSMQRYIGVKTFISVLASMATYVILIAVKQDFPGFWALMAFVLHFIPYVGPLISILLPSALALAQFADLGKFWLVFFLLSVTKVGVGHVLGPRLLGDSMNLSPVCIILALAMWGVVWGIPGMFLAVPLLAVLTITLAQFATTRPIAVLLSKTGVVGEVQRKR